MALKAGFEPTEALRMELLGHARKCLGAAVAPKEIAFLLGYSDVSNFRRAFRGWTGRKVSDYR